MVNGLINAVNEPISYIYLLPTATHAGIATYIVGKNTTSISEDHKLSISNGSYSIIAHKM